MSQPPHRPDPGALAPTVSVIVPTHDRAQFLPGAIASLQAQRFDRLEIVIVDDGSTDATPAVCRDLAEGDPRIRVVRQDNRGLAAARNTGLAEARGEWVAFLDDDDLLHPEFVRAMLEFARTAGGHAVACLAVSFEALADVTDATAVLADPPPYAAVQWPPSPPPGAGISLAELLLRPLVPVNAGLFERAWLAAHGGFDVALTAAEDYALWLDLAVLAPIPLLRQPLALVRRHGSQMTRSLARMARETRRVLARFLAAHPEARSLVGAAALRKRLAGLAREEAYAELLAAHRAPAARAALAAIRTRPGELKAWAYLALAPFPGVYRGLRRMAGRST